MIYIRDEGEPVRNGFNFYPLDSFSSAGFVLRIGTRVLWVRYSKYRYGTFTKRLFISLKKYQDFWERVDEIRN